MAPTTRNLTPFYNVKNKDSFAIVPTGMKLLEIKIEGKEHTVPGWFLKMAQVVDLNALCHDPHLVAEGAIPPFDEIVPTSLALRALLLVQKVGSNRTYFQVPLPEAQMFGRSTENNDDAQFLYGMNFMSQIGESRTPDAYYQISLVFDTRSGSITSGSKVQKANKNIDGELSIIGYLVSGKLQIPEIKADAIPPWQEIHTSHISADSVYESSIDSEVVSS